jgi:beta-N-acetylhexosaminidase
MLNIGDLIITGISGTELTLEESTFIRDEKIGGVILFSHNFENPAQLAELVNSIQKLRDEYPLFISVDQEGGRVRRFKEHFTQFPAMHDIASLNSPKIVFEVCSIMADELSTCGINLNFSPVCDVLRDHTTSAIGDRSFGKDPELVSNFVSAAIRGFKTRDILTCAKHFPGHGNTSKDSHEKLPILNQNLTELKDIDLPPFIKASKARVDMVMMGHLLVDCIDPDLPSSLSSKCYNFLRDQLKFNKVIVSDDMDMKGITSFGDIATTSLMAIQAGCDVLIYREFDHARQAYISLRKASKTKELKNSRTQESLDRIYKLKKECFSDYKSIYIPEIKSKIGLHP